MYVIPPHYPTAWGVKKGMRVMLGRNLLWSLSIAAWCTSAVWGRAEFHIGGPTGTSWQGLITDEQTEYSIVDDQAQS